MAAVSLLLSVLLWIVGVVLGLLLLAVAALLFLPVNFRLRLDAHLREDDDAEWGFSGFARWAAEVRWGGWMFRLQARGEELKLSELMIRILGVRVRARRSAVEPAKGESEAGEKPKAERKRRRRPSLSDLRSYAREGIRLVRRLVASLRLHLRGDLVFGFPDPALTGLVLAVLSLTGTPGQLRLRPDWFNPGLEGWVETDGRIYGYEVAAALWSAYWRSPLGERLRQRITAIFKRPKRMTGGRTA